MKDLIDERNFREMCNRSIVKSYNVHYMTQEEIEEQKLAKQKEEKAAPKITRHRYKSEEKALDEALEYYGMDPNDPVTREQIEQILGEREDRFMEDLMSAVNEQKEHEREIEEMEKLEQDEVEPELYGQGKLEQEMLESEALEEENLEEEISEETVTAQEEAEQIVIEETINV